MVKVGAPVLPPCLLEMTSSVPCFNHLELIVTQQQGAEKMRHVADARKWCIQLSIVYRLSVFDGWILGSSINQDFTVYMSLDVEIQFYDRQEFCFFSVVILLKSKMLQLSGLVVLSRVVFSVSELPHMWTNLIVRPCETSHVKLVSRDQGESFNKALIANQETKLSINRKDRRTVFRHKETSTCVIHATLMFDRM